MDVVKSHTHRHSPTAADTSSVVLMEKYAGIAVAGGIILYAREQKVLLA